MKKKISEQFNSASDVINKGMEQGYSWSTEEGAETKKWA